MDNRRVLRTVRWRSLEKHDSPYPRQRQHAHEVIELDKHSFHDIDKLSGDCVASVSAAQTLINTSSCVLSGQTGTAFANLAISIECAPRSRKAAISGHGGARNRADRISESLTLAQCRNLMSSAMTAIEAGRAFNRFITVHWELAGIADNKAMAATTTFLKALREWAGTAAYVWARENGDGKGSHLHILAHIPAGKRWRGSLSRRWLERITGNPYRRGVILTRCIAGAREPDGALYQTNLFAVLKYVLKGAEPKVAAALGMTPEPGGSVIGKRCGASRNIANKITCRSDGADHDEIVQSRRNCLMI